MGRQEDNKAVFGSKHEIPPGSVYGITLTSRQIAGWIKYFSGGSLEIGMTLGSAPGTGYLMGTPTGGAEVAEINCAGTFYVLATGATVTAYVMIGTTAGSEV